MLNLESMRKNLILLAAVAVLVLGFIILTDSQIPVKENFSEAQLITPAKTTSAQEIYPLFQCPCCGQPLDPENICCPMAAERITYIDGLVQGRLPEDEVILAYVQKYGLESFIDDSKKEEFKKKLISQAPADRPIIEVIPEYHDLGDVSQQGGVVTAIFEIKNNGESDLTINRLETSCGCTSAAIIYKDEEGPRFAMPGHGINEGIGDWQVVIPAKEAAQLKVYYDPDVHPDFRGAAIREISVYSDDPVDFQKKVRIELNQVE